MKLSSRGSIRRISIPGYLMRGMHLLPKRGDTRDWAHTQDYWGEKDELPTIDLDDKAFVYG